uniref:cyclin N-terminal domain-containing protein 1 n=1 Tax=Myxine glutinosa TaxID=7769 RepID=UPI00358EB2CD
MTDNGTLRFGASSIELLECLLFGLSEEEAKSGDYCIQSGAAETIFLICQQWLLPTPAKYQALMLFDRFMLHLTLVHCESNGDLSKLFYKRVHNDLLVWMVSCIQIASKQAAHYKIVTLSAAERFLKKAGHPRNPKQLLESELSVLKMVDFKIGVNNPLVYLEVLLEVLGNNDDKIRVDKLHASSVKVLDFIYLLRETKCKTTPTIAGEETSDKRHFLTLRKQFMLLATAAISSAAHVAHPEECSNVKQQSKMGTVTNTQKWIQ